MHASRRQYILIMACGSLPVMSTASLAPLLPELHKAFAHVSQIDVLSRMVLTMPALAIALGAGMAGYVIDRFGRRPLLLFSLIVFALFGSAGLWAQELETVIAARFLFGFGVAGIMTTTVTMLADMFSGEVLRRMVALQAGIMGVFGVLSQTTAGWLAEFNWRWPFGLYLIGFPLFALVFNSLLSSNALPAEQRRKSFNHEKVPYQVWLIGFFSFAAMGLFLIGPIQVPFYLSNRLRLGPTSVSILVSILTAASSLASLGFALSRRRHSQKLIVALGFLSMAVGFALLSFWTRRLMLAAGMAAIGFGIGSIGPCISAWIAELVVPSYRGRALGLLTTANYLGQFLTPLWSQELLEVYGFEGLFLATGLIAFLFHMAVVVMLRSRLQGTIKTGLEVSTHLLPTQADLDEGEKKSS